MVALRVSLMSRMRNINSIHKILRSAQILPLSKWPIMPTPDTLKVWYSDTKSSVEKSVSKTPNGIMEGMLPLQSM